MVQLIRINESNWDKVLLSSDPMLILCWAAWSDDSLVMKCLIDVISGTWTGKPINFGLINTDENLKIARELEVGKVPTLLFFDNDEVRERIQGLKEKKSVIEWVNKLLS